MNRVKPTYDAVTSQVSPNAWLWRRRVGLTPFYMGLAMAVLAGLSFFITPAQTALAITIVVLGTGTLAQQRWGKKKDRAMRNFVWVVIAVCSLFILTVRNGVISSGWIFVLTMLAIFGLGMFWWKDSWNIKRVKIERDLERWPVLRERLSMPQSVNRGPVQETETGRRWRFWWDEGTFTLRAFKSKDRELESALGIPENRIRFEHEFVKPGMKNPNVIIVSENTESAILKGPVPFDYPTMTSISDEMLIGQKEDGTDHLITWYRVGYGGLHTLAAGSTGSGKSGLYDLVLAESAYCPDLIRWGIDAKGGMTLRPWAPLFDWMVDSADDGAAFWMMQAVATILKKRSKYAASKGWKTWRPSARHPVLMLVIDEAAEVFGIDQFDMNDFSASVARMGRAAGVIMFVATQHPTNDAIGSSQLMKNLRRRFCFSVEDMHAQSIIIPKSSDKFDASEIPLTPAFAGTYFTSEGGEIEKLSARVRFVDERKIYELIMKVTPEDSGYRRSKFDPVSLEGAIEGSTDPNTGECAYADRYIYTVEDAIDPDDVDQDEADEEDDDYADEPDDEPADAPTDEPPDEPDDAPAPAPPPLRVVAYGPPPGAPPRTGDEPPMTDQPTPTEGEQPMTATLNLTDILTPRTPEEKAALEQAVAAYTARYAEGSVSAGDAQRMLDAMLDAAPPDGITIDAMRTTLPRSPSWYSDELRTRMVSSNVIRPSTGRYTRPRGYDRRHLTVVDQGPVAGHGG